VAKLTAEEQSYAVILSVFLRRCQHYRRPQAPATDARPGAGAAKGKPRPGVVQMVDEAHRIFDNDSRHSGTLASAFGRVMREGRSVDHSIILRCKYRFTGRID
jgi:DNA helicase HerA-like ATPase